MPLTQDEIIEILDQAKPSNWHEAMISANNNTFEMDYESAISNFIQLENLKKYLLHKWSSSDRSSRK
jgi:hypothetical protein